MIERKCHCGKVFLAKEADVKRGWAKACCKSHAAISRERKLDRNNYKNGGSKPTSNGYRDDDDDYYEFAGGWDEHKDCY